MIIIIFIQKKAGRMIFSANLEITRFVIMRCGKDKFVRWVTLIRKIYHPDVYEAIKSQVPTSHFLAAPIVPSDIPGPLYYFYVDSTLSRTTLCEVDFAGRKYATPPAQITIKKEF
jgi:hypothetical protein